MSGSGSASRLQSENRLATSGAAVKDCLKKWPFAVIIALALAAFALRMARLDYFNLSGDETITGTFSTHRVTEIIDALRHGEPHPPLLYLAYHLWIPFTGDSELALRFPSVMAGVATVGLTFIMGKRLLSRGVGLFAAAFVAINPYHLWNAQDARMYTFATLCCLSATYAVARALGLGATANAAPGSDSRKWLVHYVVAMTLALYTHYYSAYTFALLNLFAVGIIVFRRDRSLVDWVVAQCAIVALYAPWLALGWKTITTYHGNGVSPSLVGAATRTLTTFATGYVLSKDAATPVAAVTFVVLATGIAWSWRRSRASAMLLLLSLLVPIGGVFLASLERPVFNERYLMAASPACYILIGACALGVRRSLPTPIRTLSMSAISVLAVASLWLAARYETATTTVEKARDASTFGEYLASQVSPADRVLFNTIDPTFAYYYRKARGSAPTLVAPSQRDETLAQLDGQLSSSLSGAERVLVVPDGLHVWDTHNMVPDWLTRHAVWVADQRPTHQLVIYKTIRPNHPLSIRYGDNVHLLGYDIADAEAIAPGSEMIITFLWQAAGPLSTDYTVSVQVIDPNGRLVVQSDGQPHDPQGGMSATTTWRPSETVPDKHIITLTSALAPGPYSLNVAVYDLKTLQRLPVAGSPDGLARLGVVRVG